MFNTTEYINIPPHEIDNNINWLRNMIIECEYRISKLEAIKRNCQNTKNHRLKINNIAEQVRQDKLKSMTYENKINHISKTVNCTPERARQLLQIIERNEKHRKIKDLNKKIIDLYLQGHKKTHIARKIDRSRQHVHNVIKSAQEKKIVM